MANRAYASVWCKGFCEGTMLGLFEKLLETAPFSGERPGFTELLVRAVNPRETPLLERDLRGRPLRAAELVELLRDYVHADSSYEAQAYWDLWVYDAAAARWQRKPQRVEIACLGEEYDDGACRDAGHFLVDVGFEHLFTGHAGLLASHGRPAETPQDPAETAFLNTMAQPENLREYHEKTRENIRQLLGWLEQIQGALPVERFRLWSEGEENFEARLDEILAGR